MNSMKRQKDMTPKDELPRSAGAQYATEEEAEPKQKQCPAVDVTDDRSKVQCCKEQYCIGTWNVRPMDQGKLEVVKLEMAKENINILDFQKSIYFCFIDYAKAFDCGSQETVENS